MTSCWIQIMCRTFQIWRKNPSEKVSTMNIFQSMCNLQEQKLQPQQFDGIVAIGDSAKDMLMMWEDEQSPHTMESIIIDQNVCLKAIKKPTCINCILMDAAQRVHIGTDRLKVRINQKINHNIIIDHIFIVLSFEFSLA